MHFDNQELRELLELCRFATKQAGRVLKSKQADLANVTTEYDPTCREVKVAGDRESDFIIRDILTKESGFAILSEESGWHGSGAAEDYYWVADPLDGSFNYWRGIPYCCVALGLWCVEKPVLGVVNDFLREETFSGLSDGGAWLNHSDISVATARTPSESVLATGFPARANHEEHDSRVFALLATHFKKIRMLGSAAMSLAYVAAGKLDAYMERGIMLWDVGGGLPVVLGAGGVVNLEKNLAVEKSYNVIASNQHLLDAVEAEVRRA
jgi:fructose-1,6-bisphosphatase/inositol monophosphatase family enzyme